jgi:hypothetical protein
MKEILIIIQLYVPAILFLLLLVSIFRIKKIDDALKLKIPIFGPFGSLDIPIKNKITAKLILCLFIFLCIGWYIWLMDFSTLFPSQIKVKVSFDRNEVKALCEKLNLKEINGTVVDLNDSILKRKYIHNRDSILAKFNNIKPCFESAIYGDLSKLSISGGTSFIVKKKKGFHNYLIEESKGNLDFKVMIPHKNEESFRVAFELIPSPNDKIEFSITEHLFKNKILLKPSFLETLVVKEETGLKLRNDHELYGVTELTFFPMPKLSNTLYLYKIENKLIPICYAVNLDD